ncbi:MAG: Bax inhibitor-1/YccA family protein [Actinobacteria bacterium]|nr:Bax inhibitor-1/YccA family protein [Actinomycetota bacterium]
MQSRNPVLNRISSEQSSGSGGQGFAYDEGRSAYQQAATAQATMDAATVGQQPATSQRSHTPVTLNDVIVKTGINFVILLVGGFIGWQVYPSAPWVMWVALLVGLGLAMANIFMKKVQPVLVMLYAFVEGVFLGGISFFYDALVQQVQYEGLVQQAIIGTLVAFGVMLALYSTNIIKVNGKFMKVMMVALISYALIAFASLIAAIFGVGDGWGFYGVGTLGLVLCALGVLLAAFTLNLDFEAIKQSVAMGMPERESWRLSFGLLVTLIWLYLEILRFLAIFALARE